MKLKSRRNNGSHETAEVIRLRWDSADDGSDFSCHWQRLNLHFLNFVSPVFVNSIIVLNYMLFNSLGIYFLNVICIGIETSPPHRSGATGLFCVGGKGLTNWSGTWCLWSSRFSTNMCLLCVLMSAALLSDCSGPSQALFIVLFPSEPGPGSGPARTYRRRHLALSINVDRIDWLFKRTRAMCFYPYSAAQLV